MIEGGYYIKSRQIAKSKIALAPPHTREIWDWLLREANHKDVKVGGIVIKRGQLLRSYKDIQEGLHWMVGYRKETYKKWHCDFSMRLLTKLQMIETTRMTRGILITVCNYDYYQDPKNYEKDSETDNERTMKRQLTATINKNDKNVKNDNSNTGNEWKKDFNVYKKDLREAYNKVLQDEKWIRQQQRLNPGVDIELTLEKSCVNFWATEAGWKHKIKKRLNDIDWPGTFRNALTLKGNRVYQNNDGTVERKIEYL